MQTVLSYSIGIQFLVVDQRWVDIEFEKVMWVAWEEKPRFLYIVIQSSGGDRVFTKLTDSWERVEK